MFGDDLSRCFPIVARSGSDSAFDNVLELLVLAGRPLPHAMMMMIPEAWTATTVPRAARLLRLPPCLMEPWDGPAAIAFTDGRVIGATLDRNGLRPGRYLVTKDDLVDPGLRDGRAGRARLEVLRKGRLSPAAASWSTWRPANLADEDVKRELATGGPTASG